MFDIYNPDEIIRIYRCLICGREIKMVEKTTCVDLKIEIVTTITHEPPVELACAWLIDALVTEQKDIVKEAIDRILHIYTLLQD